MLNNSSVFITDAIFSEMKSQKHKPVFVPGRNFNSLSYRYSGEVLISAAGNSYRSVEDTITFIPEKLSYRTEVLKDTHMTVVHFTLNVPAPENPIVIPANDPSLCTLFKSLTKSGYDISSDLLKTATFYEILAALNKQSKTISPSSVPEKVAIAKEIIDLKFSNPYFSIDTLSEEVGVSSSYLRREFSASYKTSPIRYLKELRIRHAKNMLLYENRTVTETAKLSGYTSTSYFIQDFHKATGESPDKYRNRFKVTP